jgi:hypothetical protein
MPDFGFFGNNKKPPARLTQVAFVGYPTAAKKKPVTAMETQKKSPLPSLGDGHPVPDKRHQ